jgi:hypothetical protein
MYETTKQRDARYGQRSRQVSLSPFLLEETGFTRADILQARGDDSGYPVSN